MSFFGGGKVSFEDAFPEIEFMEIHVSVKDQMTHSNVEEFTFTLDSPPPPTIRCHGKCSGGSHDIERAIRASVINGGGEVKEGAMCRGREPMGRGLSRSCTGGFTMTGNIKLRDK